MYVPEDIDERIRRRFAAEDEGNVALRTSVMCLGCKSDIL